MHRLKAALERLDEKISELEEKLGVETVARQELFQKQAEQLKASRTREAGVLAVAQKVATRLDQTIQHVERVLRD